MTGAARHTVTVDAPRPLELMGQVKINGKAVSGGTLGLYRPTPEHRATVSVNEEGSFSKNIPAGFYWISYTGAEVESVLYGLSMRRDILEDELQIDFTTVAVELFFTDADGHPVALGDAMIYNADLGRFSVNSGTDGKATIDAITPGRYNIFVDGFGSLVVPKEPSGVIQLVKER